MHFSSHFWKWIKNIFKPQTVSTELFSTLDVGDLEHSLNIRENARKNGIHEEPKTNSLSLDKNEKEIQDELSIYFNEAHKVYDVQMTRFSLDIHSNIDIVKQEITELKNKAGTEIKSEMLKWLDSYKLVVNNHAHKQKIYERFKSEHNIIRDADYPKDTLDYIGFIAFIFVIEIVINANFFAAGSERGLLGGVMESFIISLLNIGFGYVFGIFVRDLNNTKFLFKIRGIFSLSLEIIFTGAFNLFAAHYRNLFETLGRNEALALAGPTMKEKIWVTNADSIWLLLVGMLCCFLAMYKGYKSDDAIPGYGKIDRDLRKSEKDLAIERHNIVNTINITMKNMDVKFENCRENLKTIRHIPGSTLSLAGTCDGKYNCQINHLNKVLEELITIYRKANKKARTSPVPIYFMQIEKLPFQFPHQRILKIESDFNQFEDSYASAISELEATANKFSSIHDDALEEIKNVTANSTTNGERQHD